MAPVMTDRPWRAVESPRETVALRHRRPRPRPGQRPLEQLSCPQRSIAQGPPDTDWGGWTVLSCGTRPSHPIMRAHVLAPGLLFCLFPYSAFSQKLLFSPLSEASLISPIRIQGSCDPLLRPTAPLHRTSDPFVPREPYKKDFFFPFRLEFSPVAVGADGAVRTAAATSLGAPRRPLSPLGLSAGSRVPHPSRHHLPFLFSGTTILAFASH